VLISGHHGQIDRWRQGQRVRRTFARRPELLKNAMLTVGEREALDELAPHDMTPGVFLKNVK